MPEEQEIKAYSLCDDCLLKDQCGTSSMPGIVLSCGKRAKYEAEGPKERHEAQGK